MSLAKPSTLVSLASSVMNGTSTPPNALKTNVRNSAASIESSPKSPRRWLGDSLPAGRRIRLEIFLVTMARMASSTEAPFCSALPSSSGRPAAVASFVALLLLLLLLRAKAAAKRDARGSARTWLSPSKPRSRCSFRPANSIPVSRWLVTKVS